MEIKGRKLWSPIWGWYREGEWEKKRLESIKKAERGLEELEELGKDLEVLGSKIEQVRLLECVLLNKN